MKTKIIRSISILVLAGVASSSIATNVQAADFNYNYIEGSYENHDIEGRDAEVGKFIGSYEISPKLNVIGEYSKGHLDNAASNTDLDFEETTVGMEYHTSVTAKTDVTSNIKYIHQNLENFDDEDGYGIGVGLRHKLTDKVELDAKIDFKDVDDSEDTQLKVGARYYLNDDLSVGAAYSTSEEHVDIVSGNIRWNFK